MVPPGKRTKRSISAIDSHGHSHLLTTRSLSARRGSSRSHHKERSVAVNEVHEPSARRSFLKTFSILGVVVAVLFLAVTIMLLYSGALKKIFKGEHGSCLSAQCQQAYKVYHLMLDESASPCQDFFQYSCGGASRVRLTPANILLADPMSRINQTFYEYPVKPTDKDHLNDVVNFYRSCNRFKSESRILSSLQRKTFRSLEISAAILKADSLEIFNEIIHMSLDKGFDTLLAVTMVKYKGAIKVRLTPGSSLRRKFAITKTKEDIFYFEKYFQDFLSEMDRKTFDPKVARTILNLDTIFRERVERSTEAQVLPASSLPTVANLTVDYWINTINTDIDNPARRLRNDSTLVVDSPEAIKEAATFIFMNDAKLVSLYFVLQVSGIVIQFQFYFRHVPAHTCIMVGLAVFPRAFVTLLAREFVGTARIERFRAFFERIRKGAIEHIAKHEHFDDSTKKAVEARLNAAKLKIISPDVEGLWSQAPRMTSDFVANYISMVVYRKKKYNMYPQGEKYVRLLEQPIDYGFVGNVAHPVWGYSNAVPVSMMVPPEYFDADTDSFVDYATLGVTLAVFLVGEIVDIETNSLPTWWPKQALVTLNETLTCYDEQFAALTNGTVPSSIRFKKLLFMNTQGMALASSFAGLMDEKSRRLFFGRFCQRYCESSFSKIVSRATCHFAVQSSPLFFQTFHCRKSDQMTPQKACEVHSDAIVG